jgi:hypothetical protein
MSGGDDRLTLDATGRVWERVTPSVRAGRRYPARIAPDGSIEIGPLVEGGWIERIEVFAADGTPLWYGRLTMNPSPDDFILVSPFP